MIHNFDGTIIIYDYVQTKVNVILLTNRNRSAHLCMENIEGIVF